ncbi:MAG: hypothetical protein WC766_06250 [Patescibacteria group bacterium]|jgi:hypothetical protein
MKTLSKLVLALSALIPSVAAAEVWETTIGQGLANLAGNQTCNTIFFTGNCGFYLIGILAFIAFIGYCFTTGLSSEATVPLTGLLLIFLSGTGFVPTAIGVTTVIIAGIFIYKGLSQVPNG